MLPSPEERGVHVCLCVQMGAHVYKTHAIYIYTYNMVALEVREAELRENSS